jgi:methanogenic corrinoid protein MtbC1
MGVVGRLWECGAINVGRQHLASHIVDQAVREQWVLSPGPGAGATPVVIVLPEREEHALGADMAAILLRANGRKPLIIHAEGPASD